jgi:hypothetical protein
MAMTYISTVQIQIVGDGAATTFTIPPYVFVGTGIGNQTQIASFLLPTQAVVRNSPVAVNSAVIDVNGNLVITFASAYANGQQATISVDLTYPASANPAATTVNAGQFVTVANSVAPTYVSGTSVALSTDLVGSLRTMTNLVQVVGTTLGTPQTFGTAPTGVVIGTSSDIYVSGTRARSNQTTTAAGVQDVNIVGALGVTNSVTNGVFMAITDNTTKVGVIAGTTALKTDMSSIAGTATVTAATGIQKVGVVGNAGSAFDTVSTQNQAMPANMIVIGGEYNTTPTTITTGNASPLQLDSAGSVKGTTPDRSVTVSLTAVGQTAQIALEGRASMGFNLSSMGTGGQVVVEGSIDGANWFGLDVWSEFNETWVINPATVSSTGNWWVEPVGAMAFIRLRVTALTSGTITGTLLADNFYMGTFEFQAGEGTTFPNNLVAIGGKGSSDGLMHGVKVDSSGSLQVTQSPASTSNTSAATWNSSTALNTAVVLNSAAFTYASLLLTLSTTTTITAGAVTFEVSNDAVNWVAISGVNAGQFGSLGINGVYPLTPSTYVTGIFNTTAWQNFRVRLSTAITGTGALTIGFAAQAAGSPPIVAREPKDFGRTFVCITMDDVVGPAAEALVAFTLNKGGTSTTGNTTYTVTAGKTLRLQSVNYSLRSTSGTQDVKVRIRSAASVLASSPILWQALESATTTLFDHLATTWPDGLEIAGGQQLGISAVNVAGNVTGLITLAFVGYEY